MNKLMEALASAVIVAFVAGVVCAARYKTEDADQDEFRPGVHHHPTDCMACTLMAMTKTPFGVDRAKAIADLRLALQAKRKAEGARPGDGGRHVVPRGLPR